MKTMMAMMCSIIIMISMMMMNAVFINYLEGDILPDSSPWSFINADMSLVEEMLLFN